MERLRGGIVIDQKLVSLGALVGFLASIFATGCGGISARSSILVSITSPASPPTIQIGQTVNITAAVSSINGSVINSGLAWSLSPNPVGVACSGQACGSLTNQTATSVTYNAPASLSGVTVWVTATSVENPSLSAAISITVAAISVSVQNKLTRLAAGTGQNFSAMFTAAVQNDPNSKGVTWSLTANGAPCSPACGTLSIPITYEADYTPPPTVPAAPANMPTITATSLTDSTKSDTDTFTIFDGATACGTGGNESVLNGQYAAMLQGWSGSGASTPLLFGASFGADGTGKITGGQDQFNPFFNHSYAGAPLIPTASSYSVGPDNRGCLTLTDQFETTFTLRFSLGGITNGIASKGDVIYFSQQSSTSERASGILRRQDPTAFSLSALAPTFVLGVDGWGGSSGALTHDALAGSFAQSGGTLSNPAFDANSGGEMHSEVADEPGANFGTIQPIAEGTGLAYASLILPGASGGPSDVTVYVINSSELFFISNDLIGGGNGTVFSGRAIAAPASFSSSSVLPNYILRFSGSSSGAAAVAIGLAGFSGGSSGSVTGSIDQYSGGTASQQNLTGTYGFTEASGRLAIVGAASDTSPICYLTGPLDGVSAFCISTDSTAGFGVLDAQPAARYGNSSLSGNYFFGSMEPVDITIPGLSGVVSIASGSLTGTEDESALAGLSLASPFSATLTIDANGSGNFGANTVAVTNGTALYFIDEANGAAAQVQVFEK